jgi:hypothetical protein
MTHRDALEELVKQKITTSDTTLAAGVIVASAIAHATLALIEALEAKPGRLTQSPPPCDNPPHEAVRPEGTPLPAAQEPEAEGSRG